MTEKRAVADWRINPHPAKREKRRGDRNKRARYGTE
jgi:hypothetical protein